MKATVSLRRILAFGGAADSLVLALLAVSLAINVYFLRRNATELWASIGGATRRGIVVGTSLPPLVAKGVDGQIRTVRFEQVSRPTVVYVFSPRCSWCTRNYPNIRRVTSQRARAYRFVALALSDSPDEVTDYMKRLPLVESEVLLSPTSETRKAWQFGGTPETYALDTQGTVLRHWKGAFAGSTVTEIESFFGVTLPGVSAAAGTQ